MTEGPASKAIRWATFPAPHPLGRPLQLAMLVPRALAGAGHCYVSSAGTGQVHRLLPSGQEQDWFVGGPIRRIEFGVDAAACLAGDSGLVEVR